MQLDIDFLRKNHQLIHFFGLGFIQIKLDANLRMHFYHPELAPIVNIEEIHSHRYDFISTIMAGRLTQELFTVTPGSSEFVMVEENCKPDKLRTPKEVEVVVVPDSQQHFKAGDSYTSLTSEFHRIHTDFAITRLYRGAVSLENAFVIKDKQRKSVCPFSLQLTANECWEIVDRCITFGKDNTSLT